MRGMVVVTLSSCGRSPVVLLVVANIRPNVFILSQARQHWFSVLLWVHKSSFQDIGPSNVKSGSGFQFSHTSSPSATTASLFMHSLVQQHMQGKCISAVLWHNPIIHSSMHQISTHMYSTVSIAPSFVGSLTGISHTTRLPLMVFPHILLLNLLFPLPYLLFLQQSPQNNLKGNL